MQMDVERQCRHSVSSIIRETVDDDVNIRRRQLINPFAAKRCRARQGKPDAVIFKAVSKGANSPSVRIELAQFDLRFFGQTVELVFIR